MDWYLDSFKRTQNEFISIYYDLVVAFFNQCMCMYFRTLSSVTLYLLTYYFKIGLE